MNEDEARQHVQALKFFYGHLSTYAIFMAYLITVNLLEYGENGELWVVYPLLAWGSILAVHALALYLGTGGAKRWEQKKVRELTGWNATQEELSRLSERIETLLRIVADERDEKLDPELARARSTLVAARETLNRRQSELDPAHATQARKREVVELVERLEALLTRQQFQRFDEALDGVSESSAQRH